MYEWNNETMGPDAESLSANGRRLSEGKFTKSLDDLTRLFNDKRKTRRLWFMGHQLVTRGLSPPLIRRAEKLVRQLWDEGGSGAIRTEESLLAAIGGAADVGSLPFLNECLERNVPREKMASERRALAISAIANIAQIGSLEARTIVKLFLDDRRPELRAHAVIASVRAFPDREFDVVSERLREIAQSDPFFPARFLARGALVARGAPPIIDIPNGSYSIIAVLRGHKGVSRTIEIESSSPTQALAGAVLSAYDWDDNHLYAFYFDEKSRESALTLGAGNDFQEPNPLDDLPLGALGLAIGQNFVFHFDFGDDHFFDLTVAAISERAPDRAKLPRVVAKKGRSPAQYRSW